MSLLEYCWLPTTYTLLLQIHRNCHYNVVDFEMCARNCNNLAKSDKMVIKFGEKGL